MWDRRELKALGKVAFQSNYWRCVLVALVLAVVIGGSGGGSGRAADNAGDTFESTTDPAVVATAVRTAGITAGALSLLGILVFAPVEVGCRKFFLENSDDPAELSEMGFAFRNRYGNVVLTMLLRNVFLVLWTLLFIVPGLIKSYSYRLVPYILTENPDMPPMEAITLSRELMNGQKWNTFVLDLSFIGWGLLSALTLGIVGVFYVGPYVAATDAELYKAIRGSNSWYGNAWDEGSAE